MNLKLKLNNLKSVFKKTTDDIKKTDLSDVNNVYKRSLKKLPDISHLKNIVLFSGVATLLIFILFAQRFAALYTFLPTKPAEGGLYSEGMVGNIVQLNPLFSPINSAEDSAVSLLFSGLTTNVDGRMVAGDLAESWEVSEDKKTYTFKLRDNLSWHDGERLTADDIYFTYTTIQNPDSGSPRLATWKDVKVNVLDERTVTFVLSSPYASFIYLTDVPILPEHILGDVPVSNLRVSEFSTEPVGSGPYVFDELKFVKDVEEVHMLANENYYKNRPYIDEIVLKSYPNYNSLAYAYNRRDVMGMTRINASDINREGHLPNIVAYDLAIPEYDALVYNLGSSVISDKALREAIGLVIDKDKIVEDVYYSQATPIHTAILPGYLGYNNQTKQAFDVALAKKKLAEAKYTLDGDGKLLKGKTPVSLRLVTTDQDVKTREAELIATMIGDLGIEVLIERYPLKTYIEEMIRPRNYDMILVTQNLGPDSDIYTFYHTNMAEDPGLNLSGIKNRELDKNLEVARTTHDNSIRAARYKQIATFINAQNPATFVCWPSYLYGVSREVKGVNSMRISNPKDRFWNVENWYISEKRDY